MNSQPDLIVPWGWPLDIFDAHHVGRTVPTVNDGLQFGPFNLANEAAWGPQNAIDGYGNCDGSEFRELQRAGDCHRGKWVDGQPDYGPERPSRTNL
jgi:hypothetical protein